MKPIISYSLCQTQLFVVVGIARQFTVFLSQFFQ